MITDPPGLSVRHHAARLLHELTRPDTAAVIAQLPARPGAVTDDQTVHQRSALSIKDFWTTVARLESVGLLDRRPDGLSFPRARFDELVDQLVADSPLHAILRRHPSLRPFVDRGRVTRMPSDPARLDAVYAALAEIFAPGETLPEAEVNSRIARVHDDPAEVRRALVDRGLLSRRPGSAVYRRPGSDRS